MQNILFQGKIIPRRKAHFLKGELLLGIRSLFNKKAFGSETISEFEAKFADFVGVNQAIAVSSGRKGMEFILRSLELKPQDEVIIPAYTLGDLAGIIQSLGLVPVPADIDIDTLNIDLFSLSKRINGKTKVILATHIFGMPCKIDEIVKLAKEHSIYVVEDCAHAAGSRFKGRSVGSFGDISFFSCEVIKPINTYGGGVVTTNNRDLARKVRCLSKESSCKVKTPVKKIAVAYFENIFLSSFLALPFLCLLSSDSFDRLIYKSYRRLQSLARNENFFTAFQAYLGICKLATLSQRIKRRQELANKFINGFTKGIIPQSAEAETYPNYYFFVVRLPGNLREIRKKLLKYGIDAGVGSEIADNCGRSLGWQDCPNADLVFGSTLQLPLYEGLTNQKIEYILDKLNIVLG